MSTRRTLLIRPRDPGAETVDWMLAGTGEGGLDVPPEAVVEAVGGGAATLVLPGEWLHLLTAEFPSRSRQKVRQAAPFVLEEQLAEDIEALHFALGPHLGEGRFPLAVVNRDRLAGCLEGLGRAGLRVERAMAEPQALRHQPGALTVWLDHGRAVVRRDEWRGFACETELLPALLRPLAGEDGPAVHVHARDAETIDAVAWPAGLERIDHPRPDLPVIPDQETVPRLDLLQGEFERSDRVRALVRAWRPAAILAVVAVGAQTAAMAWEARQLAGELERTRAQVEQVFHQALPDTRRMVNPRVQVQQALDRGQRPEVASTGLLALLGRAAPVLGRESSVAVEGLEYAGGTLTLRVTTRRYADLEGLREALAGAPGLAVAIRDAATRDGRTEAALRIREAQQGGQADA